MIKKILTGVEGLLAGDEGGLLLQTHEDPFCSPIYLALCKI